MVKKIEAFVVLLTDCCNFHGLFIRNKFNIELDTYCMPLSRLSPKPDEKNRQAMSNLYSYIA